MAGIFFLFLIIVAWFIILRRYTPDVFVNNGQTLAAAVPLSLSSFTALASFFTIFFSTAVSSIIALLILFFAGITAFIQIRRNKFPLWQKGPRTHFYIILIWLSISIILSLLILQTLYISPDGSVSLAAGGMAADLSYHLHQVMRIANTVSWDFNDQNFSGEFVRYPFFVNFLSGVLVKFSVPVNIAFHLPLILAGPALIFLLLGLFKKLNLKNSVLLSAVAIALFGGGSNLFTYLAPGGIAEPLLRNNSAYPAQNIAYAGLIPAFIAHQRTFVLGLGLVVVLIFFLLHYLDKQDSKSFFFSGLTLGLLPLSHIHSFIAASIAVSVVMTAQLVTYKERFAAQLKYFLLPFLFVATPQIIELLVMPHYRISPGMFFRLGWMTHTPGSSFGLVLPPNASWAFFPWLHYIWTNFSFLLLFPIVPFLFLKKFWQDKIFFILAIVSLALWTIPNLIQFQCWDFDNNKFFSFAILFSLISVAYIAGRLSGRAQRLILTLFLFTAVFTTPSAIIETTRRLTQERKITILNSEERQVAEWIKKNTPENSSFISSIIFDTLPEGIQEPSILIWSGRKAVVSTPAALSGHGIDWSYRVQKILAFFQNPGTERDALKNIPADYLIVDEELRKRYPQIEVELKNAGYIAMCKTDHFTIVSLFQ
jgi:hypothetical protein